ncbi:hypothetical protein Fcan01_16209 [Folsomia candida]|uniref:BEN domain-containing protein n=1 Tax=Folsomia candida TaxID=158441 RepID=A0A226DV46_FOLCA|nr:hypothetical protein Fcan01_16209 [Folsomia candida]
MMRKITPATDTQFEEAEKTEIKPGIFVKKSFLELAKLSCVSRPSFFSRKLIFEGEIFTLEEIANSSFTGKPSPAFRNNVRRCIDPIRFKALKDYITEIFGLKPNTVEWVWLEILRSRRRNSVVRIPMIQKRELRSISTCTDEVTSAGNRAQFFARLSTLLHLVCTVLQLGQILRSRTDWQDVLQGSLITLPYITIFVMRCEWKADPPCVQLLCAICDMDEDDDGNVKPLWKNDTEQKKLVDTLLVSAIFLQWCRIDTVRCYRSSKSWTSHQIVSVSSLCTGLLGGHFPSSSTKKNSTLNPTRDPTNSAFTSRSGTHPKFYNIIDIVYTITDGVCIILPSAIGILMLLSPCQSPFLGSLIVPENICHEIEKYRKLQVTQAYVNLCVRNRIFPSGAYVGPLIQIMASLIFLKYHDTVNLTYLAFVSAIFADAFVLNLVWFGGAGLVYSKSKAWLRKMRMQVGNVNIDMDGIMVTRKLLKSMCPIKVWFGTNFVDELTPLIIQQFCTLQTIDFLLLL